MTLSGCLVTWKARVVHQRNWRVSASRRGEEEDSVTSTRTCPLRIISIHIHSMAASTHRTTSTPLETPAHLLAQFTAPLASRLYSRQYAALYDFRLRKLRRGRLLDKAKRKWEEADRRSSENGASASGSSSSSATPPKPTYTPRILDVKTGTVTYITGIIYVEMKLKPDVLQDLTREVRSGTTRFRYKCAQELI